jgi:signal peptidase I
VFNKKTKLLFKIGEWVLFTALLGLFFISISPVLPFENLPKTYTIKTGSMVPEIQPGSVAIVTPIKQQQKQDIKAGDVIAFTSPRLRDLTVIHRVEQILEKEPLTLKTKGDNNDSADQWEVYEEDIKGRYVFSLPYLGHAAEFIKTPRGFILLVGIPALLFVISQILIIRKGIEEEVQKRLRKQGEESPDEGKHQDPQEKQRASTMLMIILLMGALTAVGIGTAHAVFTDTVSVSGIVLSTEDF